MSTRKRLTMLERAAEAVRMAQSAEQERLIQKTYTFLSPEMNRVLRHRIEVEEGNPELAERIRQSVMPLIRPVESPERDLARQWMDDVNATPEDGVFPSPPRGVVAYLEARAADWERAGREEASETEDTRTAAQWQAAGLRQFAALARLLGEQP